MRLITRIRKCVWVLLTVQLKSRVAPFARRW